MALHTLYQWGGLVLILTAVLFGLGGILIVALPGGGLTAPPVPILYYLGTVTAVLGFLALYAVQRRQAGAPGFAGFLLTTVGAILYSGPQLALVAGTIGAAGWHDVWGVAMGRFPVLLLGAPAFMIGMTLLGVATMRAGVLPRWGGGLLSIGSFVWLIAFFLSVVPGLLTVANLIGGIGMGWLGWALWAGEPVGAGRPQPAG